MPCTSPSSTDQIVLSCNQLFNNSQSSLQSGFIIVSSYNQTPCLIACLFCPIHWLNCLKEVKYPCFHQFKNFSMRVCLSTLFLICQCQGSLGHLCLQCQIKGAFSCHIQCRWWKESVLWIIKVRGCIRTSVACHSTIFTAVVSKLTMALPRVFFIICLVRPIMHSQKPPYQGVHLGMKSRY